jgi:hypothetical protein
MKTKTSPTTNSINRSPLRRGFLLLLPLALACFALAPQARATCQEGCLTGSNTVLGDDALLTGAGLNNTAIGFQALLSDTGGGDNTAIGSGALLSNRHGAENTATGAGALFNNTSGKYNTASGTRALFHNTTGPYNTAIGADALLSNTTGGFNTAIGDVALESNTTGLSNTAIGFNALRLNTTGIANTAIGSDALLFATSGFENTAIGASALSENATGSFNTASGVNALGTSTTGNNNVAIGYFALFTNKTGNSNTALGNNALEFNTTGGSNIGIGDSAGVNLTTGSNNIDISNAGAENESGKIRIGTNGTHTNTFIAGISGVTVANGVGVIIDGSGHLGTVVSSARFKDEVKPMDKASEAILALKPVTFRYKHELDPAGIPQFGLVAEDVEKVNPDLVARDEQGKPYTVRYEAVNAMLLNEFIKARRQIDAQQKQIEALTAGLQKVSAQVEASSRAQQTVLNSQ